MTYNDLKKFSDAVGTYLNRLGNAVIHHIVNEDGINEIVPLLHRATDEFKTKELRAMLNDEWERTGRTELIGDYENVVWIVNQLPQFIKKHLKELMSFDSNVVELCAKVQAIDHEMDKQLQNLRNRAETEPTQADKDSFKILFEYERIADTGIYKSFEEFLDLVIFKNVTDEIPMRRRANYLLKECSEHSALKRCNYYIRKFVDAKLNPVLTETESPAPVEAVAGDTSTPDFFHMDSFICEREFDTNGLYTFLRRGKVIKGISQEFLFNCIIHARLDLLLNLPKKNRKANKLKYTFHVLKECMEEDWITQVCELSGFSSSDLSGANLTDKVEFGNKLKDSLKIPQ